MANLPDFDPDKMFGFRNPVDHFANLAQIERSKRNLAEHDNGFASIIHDRLMREIKTFEESLNPDEEIGGYLSAFGSIILLRIHEIHYSNPYLIVFKGVNNETGDRMNLIQHTTQLNVLFVALKIEKIEERPARRLGF